MRKDLIRAGIITVSSATLAACAWAQRNGLVDFTPAPTNNGGTATEVDPTLTATATQEIVKKEVLEVYGEYLIGESGLGTITELKLHDNPKQADIDQIKSVALLQIPNSTTENLSIFIYDIVGEKGVAPFVMVSKNDNEKKPETAYVGFWVDEEGVQRPPVDGNVYKFYPLMVFEQSDGSKLVGIPDATNQGMQLPNLFLISPDGLISFFPPYTDFENSGSTKGVPMKVNALPINKNIESASEFIKLNIISSIEFTDPQGLINTSIKIDESMRMRPLGMSVDEIVINDNFPRNPENAMAQFSEHLVYKAAIKTNPEAANLTFEQFIEQWKKYKSGDEEAGKYVTFKVFDDATKKEISISPDNIEFVFGTASKLDGLHRYLKESESGFRMEYRKESDTLSIIIGYDILSVDIDSFKYFANGMAKCANLIIKYKGQDLANFNYTNIDEGLRSFIISGNNVVFQIKRNGKPASDTEAQQNP